MSDTEEFQVLLLQMDTDLVAVSRAGQLVDSVYTTMEFRAPMDYHTATSPAGHTKKNTVPITWLEENMKLPPGLINNIPVGTKELFANQAGLRFNAKGPLTAALHIQWGSHGTSSYEIVIGGKSLTAKFTLKKLMGLEDRDNGADTSEVTAKINPEAIEFPVNRSVTKWRPITTMFPDLHVSEGANVRWETKQVLVRLRLKANLQADSTSNPVLLLEALVLPEGTWEAVPGPKQKLLSSNHSSAIRLWSTECTWYSPLPQYKLPTVSGMMRLSLDTNLPAEFKFRWTQQAVLRRCDHGRTVVSKKEYEAYMDKPYMATSLHWRTHSARTNLL